MCQNFSNNSPSFTTAGYVWSHEMSNNCHIFVEILQTRDNKRNTGLATIKFWQKSLKTLRISMQSRWHAIFRLFQQVCNRHPPKLVLLRRSRPETSRLLNLPYLDKVEEIMTKQQPALQSQDHSSPFFRYPGRISPELTQIGQFLSQESELCIAGKRLPWTMHLLPKNLRYCFEISKNLRWTIICCWFWNLLMRSKFDLKMKFLMISFVIFWIIRAK